MSTSGTYSWNSSVDEIIYRALRMVGELPVGNTPSTAEYANAKGAFNALIKRISVDGVKLWTLTEVVYPIATPSSVLGTDGGYYFAIDTHTSAPANKPISGASWEDMWASGADATTTAWISGASYTTSHELSLAAMYQGVDTAFYRENGVDYGLKVISQQEYFSIEDKFIRATLPTHLAVDSNIGGMTMSIYPYPYGLTGRIHINAITYIQDIGTSGTDNPALPAEWMEALAYMLAATLADEYRVDLNERGWIANKADKLYKEACGNDRTVAKTSVVTGGYSSYRSR